MCCTHSEVNLTATHYVIQKGVLLHYLKNEYNNVHAEVLHCSGIHLPSVS